MPRPVVERSPGRREKDALAIRCRKGGELPLNLVWREKIIRIQKLDIVPLTMPISIVLACRKTTILCRDNRDPSRGEFTRNFRGPIRGPVIYHDDLFARPGLSKGRL